LKRLKRNTVGWLLRNGLTALNRECGMPRTSSDADVVLEFAAALGRVAATCVAEIGAADIAAEVMKAWEERRAQAHRRQALEDYRSPDQVTDEKLLAGLLRLAGWQDPGDLAGGWEPPGGSHLRYGLRDAAARACDRGTEALAAGRNYEAKP